MVASPLCDRCSESICDSEDVVSTASKRFFHRSCFVCSQSFFIEGISWICRQTSMWPVSFTGRIRSLSESGSNRGIRWYFIKQRWIQEIFQIFCTHCFLSLLQPLKNGDGILNSKTAINGQNEKEENGKHSPVRCRTYEHQLRTLQLHDDDGVEESVEDDDSVKSVEDHQHPIILVQMDESQRKRTTPFGASPIPEADELESLHSQPVKK